MKTPIEILADALARAGHPVDDVLVPEQCLVAWIGDRQLHLTAQEMPA